MRQPHDGGAFVVLILAKKGQAIFRGCDVRLAMGTNGDFAHDVGVGAKAIPAIGVHEPNGRAAHQIEGRVNEYQFGFPGGREVIGVLADTEDIDH